MPNICVVGFGNVGKATAKLFSTDKYYDINDSTITLEEAGKCDFVFICLPTPTINGECYVDDIVETVKTIKEHGSPLFVIRSTVTPGTSRFLAGEGISVVSNPEFGSQDTMYEDMLHPPFIVIGYQDIKDGEKLKALYEGRIRNSRFIMCDATTAEMSKYALNTFFATKVAFANQMSDVCDKSGANYETVKSVLMNHPWGSRNHFEAIYNGKRGLGGACLPKDLTAFTTYSQSELLKGVKKVLNGYPDTEQVD